jgi:hypothetical protein
LILRPRTTSGKWYDPDVPALETLFSSRHHV